MGIDFTGKLKQITSAYKVPYKFYRNGGISLNHAMSYLNSFGPMYLFELDGIEYLYLDRGNKDWFIDENGVTYRHDEISMVLGIMDLGLRFSDIVDMYFKEGEPLNEGVDKRKKLFIDLLGEDLINSIQKVTSAKELPIGFLRNFGTSTIQAYIDRYGSLYYFVFNGEPFIYKDRLSPKGEEYEMYINDKGESFFSGQIPNRLGLSDVGLNFSDVIDTFHNEGEPLNENVEKNKKFLTNHMGMDFTDKIQLVTSSYDVPMEFDQFVSPQMINRGLNKWGPMYLFELNGYKFLYQDRGEYEYFMDEVGIDYVDNEIPEQLGLDELGLGFSDIIDLYFNEGDDR